MPYREGQQLQLLEGESGEGASSEENAKEQKEEHGRLLSKLQWGGSVGLINSWRSIYKMGESRLKQRKDYVVSQTMSQPKQQARPNQGQGWYETRQA